MAKEVMALVKIGQFVGQFNDRTKNAMGMIIPVEISIYKDRTFSFVTKSSPAAVLLKKAAGVAKGSPNAFLEKVGQVTRAQVEEIAKTKMKDLNSRNLEAAAKIIEGTARSVGIEIVDG